MHSEASHSHPVSPFVHPSRGVLRSPTALLTDSWPAYAGNARRPAQDTSSELYHDLLRKAHGDRALVARWIADLGGSPQSQGNGARCLPKRWTAMVLAVLSLLLIHVGIV